MLFRYVLISVIYLILRNALFEDPYYWSSEVRQGRPIVYFSWYIIELLVLYSFFMWAERIYLRNIGKK